MGKYVLLNKHIKIDRKPVELRYLEPIAIKYWQKIGKQFKKTGKSPIIETNIYRYRNLLIRINNIWKQIETVTCINIYIKTILGNIQPQTVIDTWNNSYPFLKVVEWRNIFTQASKITNKPYL